MSSFILRPYQERAIQLMQDNPYHYLAFDMGLGKTLTVLEYLRRTGKKAIIFAPLLVARNVWTAEIKKWGFDFSCAFVHGPNKEVALNSGSDILITNYSSIKWLYDYGIKHGGRFLRDRVVVFDESTAFKRPQSKRFKMLQAMQHLFKNGVFNLSGEPLPNGYPGLWSQYYMLDRGRALGKTYSAYKDEFFFESGPPRFLLRLKSLACATAIQNRVAHETSVLQAQDYIELPEALYHDIPVTLDDRSLSIYAKLLTESVLDLEGEEPQVMPNVGSALNKMRQVCQGSVYLHSADNPSRDCKVLHTFKYDILKELVEHATSPVLCAVHYLFEADMISQVMGYDVPLIAGGASEAHKAGLLLKWDRQELPLLLCHPASLSHGLNMQSGGNTIVWLSLPWSLEHYKQLNGRLIRPGQKKTVNVYHLVARGTIDEDVAALLKRKDATQQDFKNILSV